MLVTLCKARYFSAVMKVPSSRGSCTSRSHPHFSHASDIHWRGSEVVVMPASSQPAAAYPFGRTGQIIWSRGLHLAEKDLHRGWSVLPARTLISHTGFLNRCARLRFVHTPRTPRHKSPATRAEHQPSEGSHAHCRTVATDCGRASCGCPRNVSGLAPSVPPGVVGTRGPVCTNSGGPRPDRTATRGDCQWASTSQPAAGGAAAPRPDRALCHQS